MDDKIKQFGELLNSVPNYNDFIQSTAYTAVSLMSPDLAQHLMYGKKMRLKGDLRTITIGEFRMWMAVTLNNVSYAPQHEFRVIVTVPNKLEYEVLKLKTNTSVELIAVYQQTSLPLDSFELVEIVKTSDELIFPYCICTGNKNKDCHNSLGYTIHERADICPVCGSKTTLVYNVYTKEARKLLGLTDSKEVVE